MPIKKSSLDHPNLESEPNQSKRIDFCSGVSEKVKSSSNFLRDVLLRSISRNNPFKIINSGRGLKRLTRAESSDIKLVQRVHDCVSVNEVELLLSAGNKRV